MVPPHFFEAKLGSALFPVDPTRRGWQCVRLIVVRSRREYARVRHDGFVIHTNTVENFFALIKRGHYGVYHLLSKRHMHRYCTEFGFR